MTTGLIRLSVGMILSCFISILLIQTTPSWGQQVAPENYTLSKVSEKVGGFQMRIEWKEKYALGEEVNIKITITNVSDKALPFSRKKAVDDINLTLTDTKGKQVQKTEFGKRAQDGMPMGAHGTDWEPGQTGVWTRNLASYYVIDKPGKYTATIKRWVMTSSPSHELVVREIPIMIIGEDILPVEEGVEKPALKDETQTKKDTDWLLPGLIAGVVLVGIVFFLLLRRKK